jgi:peptidoglycan/xylan/chitin deacetylase (PgdA/CDA1 family)
MARHAFIRSALDALWLAGSPAWVPKAEDAAGFVLTLHSVQPPRDDPFQPNRLLEITPDFLDRLLAHLTAGGWRFVTVDDLVLDGTAASAERRIAFTLDDGYRDNLAHALPVFRRHGAPFTVYVCPGFTERTAELWWMALERVVATSDVIDLPGFPGGPLAATSIAEKERAFAACSRWLTTVADEAAQRASIRALCARHGLDLAALAAELVMDWDEVRRIAADPLCTVGAHTLTHAALARFPAEQALSEMRGSAERIADVLGRRPTTLAFPYGGRAAAGEREAALAAGAGFAASFTTRPGYVSRAGSRHGLPRVSVNGLFQNLRHYDVLLSPGLWRLRQGLLRAARSVGVSGGVCRAAASRR